MLILASLITGYCSIFAFTPPWVGIPVGIVSSALGIKICAIISGMNSYKRIIKKNKKKHDKIVLLAKTKLNSKF